VILATRHSHIHYCRRARLFESPCHSEMSVQMIMPNWSRHRGCVRPGLLLQQGMHSWVFTNSLSKNRLRRCLVCRRFILRLQLSLSFFSDLQACFASPRFTASMNFLRFSQHSQSNQTGFSGPFLLRSR